MLMVLDLAGMPPCFSVPSLEFLSSCQCMGWTPSQPNRSREEQGLGVAEFLRGYFGHREELSASVSMCAKKFLRALVQAAELQWCTTQSIPNCFRHQTNLRLRRSS